MARWDKPVLIAINPDVELMIGQHVDHGLYRLAGQQVFANNGKIGPHEQTAAKCRDWGLKLKSSINIFMPRGGRPLVIVAGANLRRIDSSDSSCRHDCNDSSELCGSTDHHCNRGHDHSGDLFAADVGALNTVPENGTAPYDFLAVAVLSAVVRDPAADLDADGTASRAAVVVQ